VDESVCIEEGGIRFFRTANIYQPNYTASHATNYIWISSFKNRSQRRFNAHWLHNQL